MAEGEHGRLHPGSPLGLWWLRRRADPGPKRRQRLRAALFFAVAVFATATALVAYGFNVLQQQELQTVDARFAVRGTQPAPKDVVLVLVDSTTFNELKRQWPFPRSLHGRLIRRLHADGAKEIGYDVQFTEPTTPKEDNALYNAVAVAPGTVLATTEVDNQGHTDVLGGDANLRAIGAEAGNGNFKTDPGGVIRRMSYSIDKLKAFSVAIAEHALHRRIKPSEIPSNGAWIDFRGPGGTVTSVPFSRALNGQVPARFFRGKVVIVGASAPSLQDVHATAEGGGPMAGPEVQANAVWTALHGFPLKSPPRILTVALIVLFGLIAPLVGLRLTLLQTLLFSILLLVAYLVSTQLAFDRGWVLSFTYPLTALVLASVGTMGAHYSVAAFEREHVHDLFSRFVPEQVVTQVLARTDRDLRLGGVAMHGTVMFSDLRGFTTFSETRPPDEVIDVVNHYLQEMSDAIMSNGGTLVSYEGDGIMAVFGAPIEQPDHADRALAAAREMICERLPRFNDWLRERGLITDKGFRMGIGLNTGPFVSGNVGSERRLEYTAIGDTVNTASRIEGMTKGTRHMLLFSDETCYLLREGGNQPVFVDELEVRGKQAKVKLWSLEAVSDAPEPIAAEADGSPLGAGRGAL